jgi:hypothetical protein
LQAFIGINKYDPKKSAHCKDWGMFENFTDETTSTALHTVFIIVFFAGNF